ncbi:MAG: hypothetical protein GY712_07025 [Oceanicoccus sp.]|uniref:hypothetical protein n=1 Tax=Oceanicoccus sp. TaxID=2691044 RepID=UPI00261913D8|nr:hypothetical protein [Oceanicoccus sp.]MCP3907754.1 hypothetical protein [Oceanicoccus sp.]
MNINKLVFVVFLIFSINEVYADCLEEGLESYKQVVDAIYEEMGRPEVNIKSMAKLQHEIFIRPSNKKPAFHPKASISWTELPDGMIATVTCSENEAQRVIWRPDTELEYIEMDAVISR